MRYAIKLFITAFLIVLDSDYKENLKTMILFLYLILNHPYPVVEADPHYCYEVAEELRIAVENEVIPYKEAVRLLERCPLHT